MMKKGETVIVYNPSNDLAASVHGDMCSWLEHRGFGVTSCDSHKCKAGGPHPKADFAVSLGGDGTFLSCARLMRNGLKPSKLGLTVILKLKTV